MSVFPYNTQAWQRLRKLKLQQNRLCEQCLKVGRIEIARDVHHIVDISAGGAPFPTLDGLNSLCASCHSLITSNSEMTVKGCDAFGMPLDPAHPWNKRS
jgi:5-methylcytosine-specific restriction endonuclease McrA